MNQEDFKDDIYEEWEDKPYKRSVSEKVTEALTSPKKENKKTNLKNISTKEFNKIVDDVIKYASENEPHLELDEIDEDQALKVIADYLYSTGII